MDNEEIYEAHIKKIAIRFKELRKDSGLTQERLAEIANIDYKFYQKIEYGQRNITLKTILKISTALGIKLKDFFNFD